MFGVESDEAVKVVSKQLIPGSSDPQFALRFNQIAHRMLLAAIVGTRGKHGCFW